MQKKNDNIQVEKIDDYELVEQVLDTKLKNVIVLQPITSKCFIAEIDQLSFMANIVIENTQFVIFQHEGVCQQDCQVLYIPKQNHKQIATLSQIWKNYPYGLYLRFTIPTDQSYEKELAQGLKIIHFLKESLKDNYLDDLYEKTEQWIKSNID